MYLGSRLKFFRNLRRMTQKQLGLQAGYPNSSADIRIAQYETDSRAPKPKIVNRFAEILNVAPEALNIPNINTCVGLAHTLFLLEDLYGITIYKKNKNIFLKINNKNNDAVLNLFTAWSKQKEKLDIGEIDKEIYDNWRYNYTSSNETKTKSERGISTLISKDYQLPEITEEMYKKIDKWYETHNQGKCASGYHGAIGGNITFEITPTSIGNFITVKCSCGAKLELNEV